MVLTVRIPCPVQYILVHCPKNNLNFGNPTEAITIGAEATVYVRLVS